MERDNRVIHRVRKSTVALIVSLAVFGFAPTALAGGTAPPPPPVPKPDPPPLPPAKPKPTPVVRHVVTPAPVHHAVVKPAPVAPRPAITPPPATTRPAVTPQAPTQVVHARPQKRHAHPRPAPAVRPSAAPPLMIDRPAVERPAPASRSTSQATGADFGSTSGSGPNWILSLGILGAALSLLLLALAAVPGWVVSSPPVARFLDQHRHDFTFTGFAFLTGVVILSATVALSGT